MNFPEIVSVIDDEGTVRRATSSLLRSLGFKVRTFASAEEFLQIGDATRCLCIISDVHMPGMSGIDLYEWLRSQKVDTPVIFITSFAEKAVRARVGEDVCILQKPFRADALIGCIESAKASRSQE